MQSEDTVLHNVIGCGFDYHFSHFVFSFTLSFWPQYGPDVLFGPLTEMNTRDFSWAAKAAGVYS